MRTYPMAFSFVQRFWRTGGIARANPWVWVMLLLVDIACLPYYCWRWGTEYRELKVWRKDSMEMKKAIRQMRAEEE